MLLKAQFRWNSLNDFVMIDHRMNNYPIRKQRHSINRANSDGGFRTLQMLRAGSAQFGIFTDEIAAIVDWREPAPLPHAPKAILGVVSIQGRMLTVLDLRTLLGDQSTLKDRAQHIVALRGDEQLALAVDALGQSMEIMNLEGKKNGEILQTLNHGEAQISVLNVKELFPTAIQGRKRRRRRL
jgi:purine-binding chemotaxis protein CheW